jgi:hypothetical protein
VLVLLKVEADQAALVLGQQLILVVGTGVVGILRLTWGAAAPGGIVFLVARAIRMALTKAVKMQLLMAAVVLAMALTLAVLEVVALDTKALLFFNGDKHESIDLKNRTS